MEDEQKESPDIPVDRTKMEEKMKRHHSIFSIILLILIFLIVLSLILGFILSNINTLNVKEKVFALSDNSTLLFLKDDTYILSYKVLNEEVIMKGNYKITYGDDINENIKYEYGDYIEKTSKDNYTLAFIELQNEELYINGKKAELGYVNTYYIVRAHFEDKSLMFNGYNIDTGIKVKFEEQRGKFKEYYNKIKSALE